MERHPLRRARLAAEIREELERQKKSLASLSESTGIKIDTLYNRLNGIKPFNVEELDLIVEFLGISLDELLTRARGANRG
jgi:transcriptional regulator with XRE-family HTH domain